MTDFRAQPHFPGSAPIDAYGNGGFRFAGMSHRGSLLCLPDGVWSWPVAAPEALSEETLAPILSQAADLDLVLIGTGVDPWPMPQTLIQAFRAAGLTLDAMPTGPAVRTFNILRAEGRRVAAGLIAVE
jgi:uncharacterized protein